MRERSEGGGAEGKERGKGGRREGGRERENLAMEEGEGRSKRWQTWAAQDRIHHGAKDYGRYGGDSIYQYFTVHTSTLRRFHLCCGSLSQKVKSGFAVFAQESMAKERGVAVSGPVDPLLQGEG
jgi:hypothetical protein